MVSHVFHPPTIPLDTLPGIRVSVQSTGSMMRYVLFHSLFFKLDPIRSDHRSKTPTAFSVCVSESLSAVACEMQWIGVWDGSLSPLLAPFLLFWPFSSCVASSGSLISKRAIAPKAGGRPGKCVVRYPAGLLLIYSEVVMMYAVIGRRGPLSSKAVRCLRSASRVGQLITFLIP